MCKRTYCWKNQVVKRNNQRYWFEQWSKEGYSLRQLTTQSTIPYTTLKRIKQYWLDQPVPLPSSYDTATHLVIDGTYFSHTCCLMVVWDADEHRVIAARFMKKESYEPAKTWFQELSTAGLTPTSITLDGHIKVTEAIHAVWPCCIIQRCLYHIQRQGEMWLRRFPRSRLAQDLKRIVHTLSQIHSPEEKEQWWSSYYAWREHYTVQRMQLQQTDKVDSDIIRCYRMIDRAYPHMFHFLYDTAIPSTSNGLEGYFSHLKRRYRQHAGLRKHHLEQYLLWYVYLVRK